MRHQIHKLRIISIERRGSDTPILELVKFFSLNFGRDALLIERENFIHQFIDS